MEVFPWWEQIFIPILGVCLTFLDWAVKAVDDPSWIWVGIDELLICVRNAEGVNVFKKRRGVNLIQCFEDNASNLRSSFGIAGNEFGIAAWARFNFCPVDDVPSI